jgi:NAD(P)-dependent dehydrogenase (short-subunit alcohol dehydrogenase family)
MRNKAFLVSGGTSGIGLQLVKQLLIAGGVVHVLSRRKDGFDTGLHQWAINSQVEGRLFWQKVNFAEPCSISDLDFDAMPIFDGVVNSVGCLSIIPLRAESLDNISNLINVNLLSPIEITRQLIKRKKINSGGSLVYMSSINGVTVGAKGHTIYAATKGGIKGFVMSLSNELASKKIRVNCIAAGMVKTDMYKQVAEVISEELLSEYENSYPLGFGEVSSVADCIIYLLGDGSKWVTGQSIVVDGGVSIT